MGLRTATAMLVAGLSLASCVGVIGDHDDDVAPPSAEPTWAPAPATVHRLTQPQLHHSYERLFGVPLDLPQDLPRDDQLYGFTSIAAAASTLSPLDVERYEAAAYHVIDQVLASVARRDAILGCVLTGVDDPCLRDALADLGLKAWRRPLAETEIDQLIDLGHEVGADLDDPDPYQALRYILAAMLQSPHFLFRVERGQEDPASGLLRLTDWEMASRLSFLITDSPPDDELLGAAQKGELSDRAEIEAQARRLLDEPVARPALVRFFRDFMGIRRLDELDKNTELFPMFSATLGPAMREEIERLFENVVFDEGGDFRQLFTTRETYVNAEVAAIYGLEGVEGAAFTKVTLPDDGRRGGLLTTPGFLALNAHKTATSPTHRGRFVRISLMCQDVPPPPPGVNTTLPEPDPGAPPQTLRDKLEKHRDDPACSTCHTLMDPIGFAFEHFDALGQWRDEDNGLAVDVTTEVDGTAVEGAVEVGALVAELPEVGDCIARRFYQHATGHLDDDGEKDQVEALIGQFVDSDYDFRELVLSLVVNDGFRYASRPDDEEVKP
ncbi:MAG: DUF1592 domain-containing protein [Polyangiaceae bacterium]